ncbi:MAG: NTP transferase domain-containing protein [Ardenticatenaceae bacterium]|nr:NTP transferase domain-containing protein [Ardenticatenaceae bacterium]
MHCVITAGGLAAPDEPMYALTQGKPKALLAMNGRTMLERVVDALQGSRAIDEIVVVGLGSDMGMHFARPVAHVPDHGSLAGNIIAGADWLREHHPDETVFVFCSADIPTLTAAIVDAFVDGCRPFDQGIYYSIVTREVMEARFPHSHRTFTKLKGGLEFAGGDLHIIRLDALRDNYELLNTLTNVRKHAWKIARVAGLRLIVRLLLRQLTIPEMEAEAKRIAGFTAKIVLSQHAELGMDADKPGQVELLRKEFM